MKAFPQKDGSVGIRLPDQTTRFDMGNRRMFAAFNGRGDVTRLYLCDGLDLGKWRLEVEVKDRLFAFSKGRAIGRLWELNGEAAGTRVDCSSYMDASSPAVYQKMVLRNSSKNRVSILIRIIIEPTSEKSWKDSLLGWGVANLPRLPGLHRLWGYGWAKLIPEKPIQRTTFAEKGIQLHTPLGDFHWATDAKACEVSGDAKHRTVEIRIELNTGEEQRITWGLGKGSTEENLSSSEMAFSNAKHYAEWLQGSFPGGDALTRSMGVSGLNAAVAMFKEFPGGFCGLVAGPEYAHPARLYFRDGYWTAQVLLRFCPELVKRHMLSLARGVHRDGACPSGVFSPHLFRGLGVKHMPDMDWLPDHYDSPAFFILLLHDYLKATGDWKLLDESLETFSKRGYEWKMWQAAQAAISHLIANDADGDGLIEKPYQANDWADNVRRSTWVTYDQALYTAALNAMQEMAKRRREKDTARCYQELALQAQKALNDVLWDDKLGYFINYQRPGFTEKHFSLDTLLVLLFGLTDKKRAERVLTAAEMCQTRRNIKQPYGDWGIMCAFPNYSNPKDLFSITAQPYRYHNSADWPYLDGLYAKVLRKARKPDWRYVLVRWWKYGLEQGWLTPIEYFSPPYPMGGMLQGWSSYAAAVLADYQTGKRE